MVRKVIQSLTLLVEISDLTIQCEQNMVLELV